MYSVIHLGPNSVCQSRSQKMQAMSLCNITNPGTGLVQGARCKCVYSVFSIVQFGPSPSLTNQKPKSVEKFHTDFCQPLKHKRKDTVSIQVSPTKKQNQLRDSPSTINEFWICNYIIYIYVIEKHSEFEILNYS